MDHGHSPSATVVTPESQPPAHRPAAIPHQNEDAGSDSSPTLPRVGSTFLGFRLVAVLGQGAFGQVYLAEQGNLADRYVALKVARDIFGESQTLAQLQHTNIVPIYSIHRADPFQAVCMPYFGATTLADVIEQTKQHANRPESGRILIDTVNERKRSTTPLLDSNSARSDLVPSAGAEGPAESRPNLVPASAKVGALQQMERMSFVEAVLWIGEQIADGLAHAHERGILHHDLKPANILLTEEGQPMLLDFNLSQDTKRHTGAAARTGGTLPYMSPEHLETLRDRTKAVDARSDLFSLGVILYQMLAGPLPFPTYPRSTPDLMVRMIGDRRKPLPALRAKNRDVTPAIASIVGKCLAPDPAQRYRSARDLQEDLKRHRQNLPLKYAPEPSLRERARKWVRRHPRLTSMTSVAVMFGAFLLILAGGFVVRGQRLSGLEAQETLRGFREDARTVQFLLYSRNTDRVHLDEGMTYCRRALERFDILDNPDWQRQPAVQHLPPADQIDLHEEAGEILFLYTRATALHAQINSTPTEREERLRRAYRLNVLAEACFGTDRVPRALWEQRADLANLQNDRAAATAHAARAAMVPLRTPRDLYLIAHQQAMRGNLREARDLLQKVTQDHPRNFSAWFVRGNCCYDLLQDGNAVTCFSVCVSLRPEFHWSWVNRGLAHLRLRQFREAIADFDRALTLKADLTECHVNRALAREGLHEYREAIADYTRALEGPAASTRIYFLRSEAKARLGDRDGARRDLDLGLAAEPTDDLGWVARGTARRESNPKGALADYEQALKINPRSFDGLQNKAALLSDKFTNDPAALEVLEKAVQFYPESVLARGGRGVLLARAGKRKRAVDDAEACLLLDAGPPTLYQVACIYALTSKQSPDDLRKALPLLSAALRAGFGLDFVDRDNDLDPLRAVPEFQRLIAAARTLR